MEATEVQINPAKIMQVGMGFWASKTLLTAVNMQLFTRLAKGPLLGKEIQNQLGLNSRSLYDFLDTLVSLGFLTRMGLKEAASYSNAEETDLFLDKNKPSYMGGILEMANNRLYPFWDKLEECLKTGKLQNEAKNGGSSVFEAIYSNPDSLKEFIHAMGGVQMGNFIALSHAFDFSGYQTVCDMGGSGAQLSIQIATHNPHMQCTSFDLPPVGPIAQEIIDSVGMNDRIKIASGDFFESDFPKADVITMGNILHDWGLKEKLILMKKAYDALPVGGALVVVENVIDNDRDTNAFGLMMSLNMAIETEEGFDFSGADFNNWALEVGFKHTDILPLMGPSSAVIAIK